MSSQVRSQPSNVTPKFRNGIGAVYFILHLTLKCTWCWIRCIQVLKVSQQQQTHIHISDSATNNSRIDNTFSSTRHIHESEKLFTFENSFSKQTTTQHSNDFSLFLAALVPRALNAKYFKYGSEFLAYNYAVCAFIVDCRLHIAGRKNVRKHQRKFLKQCHLPFLTQ